MNKTLLLTGVLLALTASAASAVGLNLGWAASAAENTCPSSLGSTANKTSACLSNGGASVLIGSAVVPSGLVQVTAEELQVDLQEAAAALSDWWHFEDGACRGKQPSPSTVTSSLAFTAFFDPLNDEGACLNYWQTAASGGFNYQPGVTGPNRARISAVFAIQGSSAGPMTAGMEYYCFRMVIDNRHAVAGTLPVCNGCQDGAAIAFNVAKFDQPPGAGDHFVEGAVNRQCVLWQGGGGLTCPGAVPTHRATWGQVKSLYR